MSLKLLKIMADNHWHITGRGVAVIAGVISLIYTFAGSGIPFLGRVGLFILGVVLIMLGVR